MKDVYKRQIPALFNRGAARRLNTAPHFIRQYIGPVSYTHLDVYKRQPQAIPMNSARQKIRMALLPKNSRHTTGRIVVSVERMDLVAVLCSASFTISDVYKRQQ